MISLGLFFGRKLQLGGIFFDGHTREAPSFPLDVTSNPVEYGADTTDNAVVRQFTLELVAFVSETPGLSLSGAGLFNQFKRTTDALDILRQLQVSRQVLDVYCNTGYYQNMMITNIQPVSDENNLTTIQINISLAQIIFTGDVINEDPVNNDYKSQVDRGSLQTGASPQ